MIQAVRTLEAADAKVAEAEEALTAARQEQERAAKHLDSLIAHGRCTPDVCPDAGREAPPVNDRTPALDDPSVSIIWRIAFHLWRTGGVLKCREIAEGIYGPGLDRIKAKNRVNSHMTQLRKDGVIMPVGRALYEVDQHRLAELSGIQVPGRPG